MGKTTIVNFKGVPKGLYKRFKALCAEEDMTATEGFIRLMESAPEHLKAPGPKEEPPGE